MSKRKKKDRNRDGPRMLEWRQYEQLLNDGTSPDGLPIKPFPPGPSIGIINGKERFLSGKPGWYEWFERFIDRKTGRIAERRGWYRVSNGHKQA